MRNEFYYTSRDGKTQIRALEWIPDGEVKAVLQIVHGMAEHIERYHAFAASLAEHGIYVTGNDHLGHGKSVVCAERLGYFQEGEGNACVISDMQQLRIQATKKYPNVPYFMLGHSMGSFLLRQYLGLYGVGLSGAIIMGTGEKPEAVLTLGKVVCGLLARVKGWGYRSKLIHRFAVGAYEKKLGSAWISRNAENVKAYEADPLCGFMFTVNGYYEMFTGMQKMNRQEAKQKASKNLPLLFVAGTDDPVGNYGKSVENIYKKYVDWGYRDVQMHLYAGDRHEILNEDDRITVYLDIRNWINARL